MRIQFFQRDMIVGEHTDFRSNGHGFPGDGLRLHSTPADESTSRCQSVRSSGTDGGHTVIRLNHISCTGQNQSMPGIRHQKQCLKLAQVFIFTPVFCQLNGGFNQMA